MRATIMYGAGDVRIENVADPGIVEPTDAILRVTRACICGSDLWPYKQMEPSAGGQSMGHEAIGVVEAVGPDVRTVKPGDLVVMPRSHISLTSSSRPPIGARSIRFRRGRQSADSPRGRPSVPMVECPRCGTWQYAAASYAAPPRCTTCDAPLAVPRTARSGRHLHHGGFLTSPADSTGGRKRKP